ncbi:hypothetical protein ANRL1_00616 [Anaerolineae bacterium]|nr:hypothetical protein ANRL1_00616 [Anaerolineae bacterium]
MSTVISREGRRTEALKVAEACVRLLKERFGVRGVYLFGSARGDAPWHDDSDLDLAVDGLTGREIWQAGAELEKIAPAWLEIDLVPLDQVYPEVRARILEETPIPENLYLALKVRLEEELIGLDRINRGLTEALARVGATPDEFSARALATYLDDLYKGCERICERVAVALDGGLPQEERSHQALLGQMGEPGGAGRPPLFSGSLLLDLDEYRRFRHRVRHIYGYELEAERVLELTQGAEALVARIKTAVVTFTQWLEQQVSSV